MKYIGFILISIFVLSSCGKDDDIGPVILIDIPDEIENSSAVELEIEISDDAKIFSYVLKISDSTKDLYSLISNPEKSQISRSEQVFIDTPDDEVRLSVLSEDALGNKSSFEKTILINQKEGGSLDLNFKLLYDSDPLVMYAPITYLSGETITFTKVSTYISDITLDDVQVKDIDYLRFDEGHLDASSAQSGYTYSISGIDPGKYTSLNFNYGIEASDNLLKPADFPSGHPLAEPGEYWISWNSFIFVKIEGRIDTDNDGNPDEGFALHLGSSDAMRTTNLDGDVDIVANQVSSKDIKIDLKQVLGGETAPYNLREDGQIHSLNQLPLINLLADNLKSNTKF